MLRLGFASWFNSSLSRKQAAARTAHPRRQTGRRTLHLEQLEDRQMLSVSLGAGGAVAAGAHAAAANAGPTISHVVASAAQAKLTWNAVDCSGMASSDLMIEGIPVTNLTGPWTAASGYNYSWPYNSLPAGTYAYVITATDLAGNASQYTGTLAVGSNAGPAISKVAVSPAQGVISWNATAAGGAASCSLTIDGALAGDVFGPWTTSSGANFEGTIGTPSAGSHTYVISATDSAGQTSKYTSWFVVGASTPTINNVVLSPNQGIITWNTAAVTGVTSSTLTIDGANVTKISGPWAASSGVNYQGTFGYLASGNHIYTITSTSLAGQVTKSVGVFAVSGPTLGSVVVSAAKGVLTWNAVDSAGVASMALTIDGAAVSDVSGPYAAASGFNYAGAFGSLSTGSHTYVITATDNAGRLSYYSGMFLVTNPGPTISKVAVSAARGLMTWNAADSDGVTSTSLTIDGIVVKKLLGAYKAPSGLNYEGVFGVLAPGSHRYVITATDGAGNSSASSGMFVVS
jgi:large repetitive protein